MTRSPAAAAPLAAGAPVAGADEVDGRRARRAQNRQAVVEALISLYVEGNVEPSSSEIAERAGLSPRSLFRYFDDVEDLARAAIAHELTVAEPVLARRIDPAEPTEEKAAAVASMLAELWRTVGPVARVARVRAATSAVVEEQVRSGRAQLQGLLRAVFAPELEELEGAAQRGALAALDALTSFETFELLRDGSEEGHAAVEADVAAGLHLVLGGRR